MKTSIADQTSGRLLRLFVIPAENQVWPHLSFARLKNREQYLAGSGAESRYQMGFRHLGCQYFGTRAVESGNQMAVVFAHRQGTGQQKLAGQGANLAQH